VLMEQINLLVTENITVLIAILFFFIIVLSVLLVKANKKVQRLQENYDFFTKGTDNIDIEQLLTLTLSEVRSAKSETAELSERCKVIREQLKGCVQKVGVVRYNAFDNIGSDLSYSVSLLDEKNNGVVLSSIFGREDNRCYAKPITSGTSDYPLSEEEIAALKKIK